MATAQFEEVERPETRLLQHHKPNSLTFAILNTANTGKAIKVTNISAVSLRACIYHLARRQDLKAHVVRYEDGWLAWCEKPS